MSCGQSTSPTSNKVLGLDPSLTPSVGTRDEGLLEVRSETDLLQNSAEPFFPDKPLLMGSFGSHVPRGPAVALGGQGARLCAPPSLFLACNPLPAVPDQSQELTKHTM